RTPPPAKAPTKGAATKKDSAKARGPKRSKARAAAADRAEPVDKTAGETPAVPETVAAPDVEPPPGPPPRAAPASEYGPSIDPGDAGDPGDRGGETGLAARAVEELRRLEERVRGALLPARDESERTAPPLAPVWRTWRALAMRDRSDVVDEFGRDPNVSEQLRPVLEFLYRTWFRV